MEGGKQSDWMLRNPRQKHFPASWKRCSTEVIFVPHELLAGWLVEHLNPERARLILRGRNCARPPAQFFSPVVGFDEIRWAVGGGSRAELHAFQLILSAKTRLVWIGEDLLGNWGHQAFASLCEKQLLRFHRKAKEGKKQEKLTPETSVQSSSLVHLVTEEAPLDDTSLRNIADGKC